MMKTCGLILAGGEGRRMGYRNKGLVSFRQAPLIAASVKLLKAHCDHVIISANNDLERYKKFGVKVICDEKPWTGIGPLGGIVSVIKHLPEGVDELQLLPCDAPFVTNDVLQKLAEAMRKERAPVYVQHGDWWHPLISRCPTHCLNQLPEYLEHCSNYAVYPWLKSQEAVPVMFSEDSVFANINDEQTLGKYERN